MGGSVNMEQKGCQSICWKPTVGPWAMTWTVDFQGQILKKLYPWSEVANWHGTTGMWVYRMLDPLSDLVLWSWPWTSKVKLWNSWIPRMGGSIDMEWKGCESIGCWTHYVILTFNLTHDFGLRFSRLNFQIAIFRNGRINWPGMKGMWLIWCWTHYASLDLQYGLARRLRLRLLYRDWSLPSHPHNGTVWNPGLGYSYSVLVLAVLEYWISCTRTREFQSHSTRTRGQVLRYSYEYWHEYWYSMVHLRCKGENHHTFEINSMTYHKGKVPNWFHLL